MKYITSDPHLGHANIIKHCNRPFIDVKDMNDTIVKNWNSIVKKSDEVYILGDLCMKLSEDVKNILTELNGRLYLINGNHDKYKGKDLIFINDRFEWVKDYFVLKHFVDNEKQKIIMSHYAMACWDECYRGSIMLFGHSHGHYKGKGRSTDVGMDSNNFFVHNLDELVRDMRLITPVQA